MKPFIYVKGDWKAICESCGDQVLASELRQRWDGYYVDAKCWEPRQPQDFVRGVADVQVPPFTRPEPSDHYVTLQCTTRASYAGNTAGCLIAGWQFDTVPSSTFIEP